VIKTKSKLADRILLRAKAAHSGDFSNQLSLIWVFGHYFNLVKSKGPYAGTKDMVAIGFLLYKQFTEFLSSVRYERKLIPQLRGAPRDWIGTIETLQNEIAKHSPTANKSDEVIRWYKTLENIITHSNNDVDSATVTILLPACDNLLNVSTCIESIFTFPSRTRYTILIADRSHDGSAFSAFSALNGIRVWRTNPTCSQSESINQAAHLVTTPYLIILNPATLACPGWIDEMVNEISRNPIYGIVGPRILARDLLIREAGGVIFPTGEFGYRGRRLLSDDSRFNFSSEIDFMSSCALFIRSELWNQLGGFDVTYESHDHRDADLCLRARILGRSVRYAPLACVIHYETTGVNQEGFDSDTLDALQKLVHPKLLSVYHKILATNKIISAGTKVVCILDSMPDPTTSGGAVDFDLIIQYLVELNYQVSLLFTTLNPLTASFNWRACGVLCEQFDSPHSKQLINESEIALSFGLSVGIRLTLGNFTHKNWIHHTSDIATRRLELMNDLDATSNIESEEATLWHLDLPRDVDKMWEIEKTTLEQPSTVLFVTEFDLNYALEHGAKGNFKHFPILKGALDIIEIPDPPTLLTVGFVGNFKHSPNSDAVDYFLQTTWSLIREQMPNSQFLIWGSGMSDRQIAKWSTVPNVQVRGQFARWEDVVAQTRVFVSPLRFGAGMKHKILSSLINGRPVIGSTISFEGFDVSHMSKAVISDDPIQIVQSVVECLSSDKIYNEFLSQGLLGMGTQFSRQSEIERLKYVIANS